MERSAEEINVTVSHEGFGIAGRGTPKKNA